MKKLSTPHWVDNFAVPYYGTRTHAYLVWPKLVREPAVLLCAEPCLSGTSVTTYLRGDPLMLKALHLYIPSSPTAYESIAPPFMLDRAFSHVRRLR